MSLLHKNHNGDPYRKFIRTQPAFIHSKSIIEASGQFAKSVQR